MVKPQPPVSGIWRWGLSEVLGVRWGHRGRTLIVGLVLLWGETPRAHLVSLQAHPKGHCEHTVRRHLAVCRPGAGASPQPHHCWHPDLRLTASKLWESKSLFLKPPSQWYLVMPAQAYKTFSLRVLLPTRMPQSPGVCKQATRTPKNEIYQLCWAEGCWVDRWVAICLMSCHCHWFSEHVFPLPSSAHPEPKAPAPLHSISQEPKPLDLFSEWQMASPDYTWRIFSGSPTTQGPSLTPKGWSCSSAFGAKARGFWWGTAEGMEVLKPLEPQRPNFESQPWHLWAVKS